MTAAPSRTEAATQKDNRNSFLITSKASVESPATSWVSNRSSKEENQKHVQYLKGIISFTSLLKADGHLLKSSGRTKSCLCPFHPERSPSFHVYQDSGTAKCFSCGWFGDIIAYVRDSYKLSFPEALSYLSDQVHVIGRSQGILAARARPRVSEPEELTEAQQNTLRTAANRLAENHDLSVSVASERSWNPETIKALAEEGSLGWDGGALAFLYSGGMKSRNWPYHEFIWDFGKPGVWRGNQIGDATEVFICEGETDCISLLDKGVEEDGSMAVIALPSASTIPADLPKLVQGKHVTLCMDDDEAGARATQKLADLLVDVCASVQIFDFKGVAQ